MSLFSRLRDYRIKSVDRIAKELTATKRRCLCVNDILTYIYICTITDIEYNLFIDIAN